VRIQIEEARVVLLRIFITNKINCHMVFSTHDADRLVDLE
jgi:hypothetical protein